MNIALTKIYAVAGANSCDRFSFVRKAAVGCALGCAVSIALASPSEKEREAQRSQQMQQAPQTPRVERAQAMPAQRQLEADPRQFDQRSFEARAEEQRRNLQMQQEQNTRSADAFRRNGRLTPDERPDLRRQINEAGQDIYPNTPRR